MRAVSLVNKLAVFYGININFKEEKEKYWETSKDFRNTEKYAS